MDITYQYDTIPTPAEIIALYDSAGLARPIHDPERIAKMYAHSSLVVTAWDGTRLVGVSRALTDFCYCCYLSDLAVRLEYQRLGIGKELIRLTKQKIGDQSMLLLLSATTAMEYYPKIGLEKVENGFLIKRKV
jgi:GNAT superfamily N-acetyltransferase